MIASAVCILPDHRVTKKYAGMRRENPLHINKSRMRTFAPAVHSFGEKGPKRRQIGSGRAP